MLKKNDQATETVAEEQQESAIEVVAESRGRGRPKAPVAVTVICRLPHGLTMRHPITDEHYELRGANKDPRVVLNLSRLSTEFYGTTVVPSDFWEAWTAKNKELPALKNGAIVAITDHSEVAIKQAFADVAAERTGFEGADHKKFKVEPTKAA